MPLAKKLWKDVDVGDELIDGSKVVAVHPSYMAECYNLHASCFMRKESIVLSGDHLLLINISMASRTCKQEILNHFSGYGIPTCVDRHVDFENLDDVIRPVMSHAELGALMDHMGLLGTSLQNKRDEKCDQQEQSLAESMVPRPVSIRDVPVGEVEPVQFSDNEFWLPVSLIAELVHAGERLTCNGLHINHVEYAGQREVRCVETDTHKFRSNHLIHHNSVTLRNIIMHCLTHSESIAIALVDLKQTEFTYFKGVKGVVAVANSVQEAVEILRIMRECMYARNREMAKLGINDIKDFKPKMPTDEWMVFNHRMNGNDVVEIRNVDGEVKSVKVCELEQYLNM